MEASSAPTEAPATAEAAKPPIRIGSDNFYESKLMGEIYAQVLENAGYTVERKFGLGSRQERIPTMDAGQIDMVAEYVGSGLGFYDTTKITGDGEANAAALQEALTPKGITVLGISPGQDTNAFVVRSDTATSMNLTKMSDLAAVQDQIKWGLPVRLRYQPALRGCAQALRDHLSAEAAHRPRRLRRADGPGPAGQGNRPRRAVLDAAGDRPVRVRDP